MLQGLLSKSITKFTVLRRIAIILITNVEFVERTMTSTDLTTKEATNGLYCVNKSCSGGKIELGDTHVTTLRTNYDCRRSCVEQATTACSQNTFYVTGASKDNKIKWNTLFLPKSEPVTWPAKVHQCSTSVSHIEEDKKVRFSCEHLFERKYCRCVLYHMKKNK